MGGYSLPHSIQQVPARPAEYNFVDINNVAKQGTQDDALCCPATQGPLTNSSKTACCKPYGRMFCLVSEGSLIRAPCLTRNLWCGTAQRCRYTLVIVVTLSGLCQEVATCPCDEVGLEISGVSRRLGWSFEGRVAAQPPGLVWWGKGCCGNW